MTCAIRERIMNEDRISDDEILLRHIPAGTRWLAPGPRITSGNFQLRHDRGETGVSVTRLKITGPQRLLELLGVSHESGSRVAAARVGDVRALGFEVVPKPLEEDPGHSEIQSGRASLDEHASRKLLAKLFRLLSDEPSAVKHVE
jgi:hypothetical protein